MVDTLNLGSHSTASELRDLAIGMREAYARGDNAMEFARAKLKRDDNLGIATLIAYDLQAGAYVRNALEDPQSKRHWCEQLAGIIRNVLPNAGSLLEAGCGEATTVAGVLESLGVGPSVGMGFDISWSRCAYGAQWLNRRGQAATLFVADLFDIPLADDSVDVVYTSHSLEPNGGREDAALRELLRVARRAVVLVEPIYELAPAQAQERMRHHGYVRNLRAVAEATGFKVSDYRLLDFFVNPLNPSGLIVIEKSNKESTAPLGPQWRCPLTRAELRATESAYLSKGTGFVYPVLGGIPLLRREHAVLASAYEAIIAA